MSSVTFYGFAAWVGAIQSPTRCSWWPKDPNDLNWDTSLLIPTNLDATLGNNPNNPAAIEVDDHISAGGMTTVGPLFPQGTTIGAIWLSRQRYDKLAVQPDRTPPKGGGFDYEYTCIRYYGGDNGDRRFYGFHGHVANVQPGTGLSMLHLWHPGTGKVSQKPAGAWWIDLKANTDATMSTIQATSAVGTTGAVFVDQTTVQAIALFQPKIPPYKGGFGFPLLR